MPELEAAALAHLTRAVELATDARARGDHPFGAVLVTTDGRTIEALNSVNTDRDPTGHAETNLVRAAARSLDAAELAGSTLYTSTEPCAMCSGAIYWAGIGHVVFALASDELTTLVGGEPTLDLHSREVFARGTHPVEVEGPFALPAAADVHRGFWV